MPKKYERIRDSLKAQGKPPREAKRIAAATYNKQRPKGAKPVTGKHRAARRTARRT